MAKAPKLLTIVALSPVAEWDELVKLEEQGHAVLKLNGPNEMEHHVSHKLLYEADIVLGPNCWRMTDSHRAFLPQAIKTARMAKYGKPKKEGKKSVTSKKTTADDPPDVGC